MALKTVCLEPGCPNIVERGGRCPAHGRAAPDRPTSSQMGYDRRWARVRAAFLAAHPFCRDCGGAASVADHSPKTRRDLIAAGVENPDDWRYLEPRCVPCHGRKTAKYDGGYGNPRKLR